jgi:TonB family protein
MSSSTIEPPARDHAIDPELHLIVQIDSLRDENARSRMREALWISIIFHLLVLFSLRQIPRLFPQQQVTLLSQQDLLKQRELTYIEQPPDTQNLKQRPETNKISDKDRIATSKAPQIDRRALERLSRSGLPGAPGTNPAAPAAPPAPQVAQGQQQPQAATPGGTPAPPEPSSQSTQTARLEPPPVTGGGVFRSSPSLSPGTAIEQAARASAGTRGGISGDYGGGFGRPNSAVRSDLEILTDTMGVDFSPYMQRVLQSVRTNWYNIIPEVARPPLMKQGNVFIEFVITKNGEVKGMRLAGPSGDVSLDRAAWGGITASNPFPPLPHEFRGEYIALRFRFMYNPDRNELR